MISRSYRLSKKNRHFALESTIFVRFKIGLTFWIRYSIIKNRAENYSSKLISNEAEAIPARHAGTVRRVRLKKPIFRSHDHNYFSPITNPTTVLKISVVREYFGTIFIIFSKKIKIIGFHDDRQKNTFPTRKPLL